MWMYPEEGDHRPWKAGIEHYIWKSRLSKHTGSGMLVLRGWEPALGS